MPRKDVVIQNNAPFKSRITKINSELIDNFSMISGRFWNYYRGKTDLVLLMIKTLNNLSVREK